MLPGPGPPRKAPHGDAPLELGRIPGKFLHQLPQFAPFEFHGAEEIAEGQQPVESGEGIGRHVPVPGSAADEDRPRRAARPGQGFGGKRRKEREGQLSRAADALLAELYEAADEYGVFWNETNCTYEALCDWVRKIVDYGRPIADYDADAIYLEGVIRREKDPELKEALKDLDDYLFGW